MREDVRTEASSGDEQFKNEREDRSDNASNSFWSQEIAGGRFWKKTSKIFFVGNCGERVVK